MALIWATDYIFLQQAQINISCLLGNPVAVSTISETPGFGVENHPPYLNQILIFDSPLPVRIIFEHCNEVENQLGRDGKGLLLPRSIDIDILACGNEIMQHHDLQIPHPSMHLRKFVLEPLNEIMPGWEHPILGLKVPSMLQILCNNSAETDLALEKH